MTTFTLVTMVTYILTSLMRSTPASGCPMNVIGQHMDGKLRQLDNKFQDQFSKMIAQMNSKASQLEGLVHHQGEKLLLQQQQIDLQQNVIDNQTQQISQIASFKDDLSKQQEIINNLKKENSKQNEVNNIQEDLNNRQKDVNKKQQQVNDRITACESARVAFTARHQEVGKKVYRNNEQVKYTNVVENIHGDYDASTGTFTCSEPGIYKFDLHVMATGLDGLNWASLGLVHNGKRLTDSFTQSRRHTYTTESASAVVKLAKGDTVIVKCSPYRNTMVQEDITGQGQVQGNTFSGFLVSSDKCLP